MLSVSHCSAHHPVWTRLGAGMKVCVQLCPMSFEQLCRCKEMPFQRLFPFTWNTAGKLSAAPKWESLNVFKELLKRKYQEKKDFNILIKHSDSYRQRRQKISRKKHDMTGNVNLHHLVKVTPAISTTELLFFPYRGPILVVIYYHSILQSFGSIGKWLFIVKWKEGGSVSNRKILLESWRKFNQ